MPVKALEHVRPMRGGAQAHLMRAEDGYAYVVKFLNNPQHPRVLANELLGARLARLLKLPVPEAAIIDVSPELVAASPGLVIRQGGRIEPCAAGLQFGSRLPNAELNTPIYDYLPEENFISLANLSDFAGMLLFDKWTCNCNGRQIIYCRPSPRRRMRLFMIDQGFCFNAGDWNFPDSPLRGVFPRNAVYHHVNGWHSFEPWLTQIEQMRPQTIFELGEEIPPAWYGDWQDLRHLLDHMVRRRSRVRELISAVRNSGRAPFDNWMPNRVPGAERPPVAAANEANC